MCQQAVIAHSYPDISAKIHTTRPPCSEDYLLGAPLTTFGGNSLSPDSGRVKRRASWAFIDESDRNPFGPCSFSGSATIIFPMFK